MRIFLPLATGDRSVLAHAGELLDLPAGRPAWAVTEQARADRVGQDEEDLEYDAVQDAVHVALGEAGPAQRALVIAADAPERALIAAEATGGAYGVVTSREVQVTVVSLHVTELDAAAAGADDTDPALLWFDVTEGPEALAFLDEARPR